jgi:hypothetical protein
LRRPVNNGRLEKTIKPRSHTILTPRNLFVVALPKFWPKQGGEESKTNNTHTMGNEKILSLLLYLIHAMVSYVDYSYLVHYMTMFHFHFSLSL